MSTTQIYLIAFAGGLLAIGFNSIGGTTGVAESAPGCHLSFAVSG
jgi:hypothetical protein